VLLLAGFPPIHRVTAGAVLGFLNEKIARLPNRNKSARCSTNVALITQHDTFWGPRVESSQLGEASFRSYRVPQVITHEKKTLIDCDAEFDEFVKTMEILGPKLGPMVFQFPSFDRWKFSKQDHFLAVLTRFLKKLPADHKFVVEIRNKNWLDAKFADVLREYNVGLAPPDTSFMPRPWELKQKFDLVTADFAYVRWLGDRKGIEKQTTTWDKTVIDRTSDLKNWVDVFKSLVSSTKVLKIFAFSNNHYAGHGPATAKLFWDLWNKKQ